MLLLPFLQQPTTHQLHHQHQPSTIITTPLPPRRAPPAQGVGLTTWQSLSPFNPLCPSHIHRCRRFRDNFQVSMPFFFFSFFWFVDFFFFFYFFFSPPSLVFFTSPAFENHPLYFKNSVSFLLLSLFFFWNFLCLFFSHHLIIN